MTNLLKKKPGVKLGGIQPEMAIVLDIVPEIFGRYGHDCWLTCAVEPRDSGLHPVGRALDFDSSTHITYDTGMALAGRCRDYLGEEFDCVWHGPRWHLHVEFDPEED